MSEINKEQILQDLVDNGIEINIRNVEGWFKQAGQTVPNNVVGLTQELREMHLPEVLREFREKASIPAVKGYTKPSEVPETEDDDEDEDEKLPASADTTEYPVVADTEGDAKCIPDDEDDDDEGELETEGESSEQQFPLTQGVVRGDDKAAAEHNDEEPAEKVEDDGMTDAEFWAKMKQAHAEREAEADRARMEDPSDFVEVGAETAAKLYKRLSKVFRKLAMLSERISKDVARTGKINYTDQDIRDMFVRLGQMSMGLAMLHMSSDTIISADHIGLFNSGVAEMQARVVLWEAGQAQTEILQTPPTVEMEG